MIQMTIDDFISQPRGATFNPEKDKKRLNAQHRRVWDVMIRGGWLTLQEIEAITYDPQASISARLRDFRKMGHRLERRRRGDRGLHEYRLIPGKQQ